jgi:hypothetical protein
MSVEPVRVSQSWLELREAADGAARAPDLVDQLRPHLPTDGPVRIHDLGCGTGSMGRWLAPQLTGSQHWLLYDWDADLLDRAAADMPAGSADGAPVTVETRQRDVSRLDPADVAGSSLITASALLDLMTADELERFVMTCVRAGCPALITLSVTGRVELTPADPFDASVDDAFNAHQRRTAGDRRLLGPDAVGAAVDAFTRFGLETLVRPSPWRLGADEAALSAEWLRGWVAAAFEQEPDLAAAGADYSRRREAEATAGGLDVTVHHLDVLAWPR